MLERVRRMILEFELFIMTNEMIGCRLDYKTKDKIFGPLKECVELLKQVENKLEEHSKWADKELERFNQLD